jgi:hypothetical protein
MGALEQAIQQAMQLQADRRQIKQIISGTATNVGETACDVLREDAPVIYSVRLNAIDDNLESFVTVYPQAGSFVLVGIVENLKTEAVLLRCSEVEKVKLKIGGQTLRIDKNGFVFNDGKNDGLVKIEKLEQNLDNIKNYLNALNSAIASGLSATVANGGAAAATAFSTAMQNTPLNLVEMENEKITH